MQVTRKTSTGLLAAVMVAIVPSYISRSVGGSYDNEGVAIFALIFSFYTWIKSVNTGSIGWAVAAALAYAYMVAAWGGYVFIINIIPIYVVVMTVAQRFTSRLYVAYSVFYVVGSLLAMQVPFVGFNVLQQAECAASHGVFVLVQREAPQCNARAMPCTCPRAHRSFHSIYLLFPLSCVLKPLHCSVRPLEVRADTSGH